MDEPICAFLAYWPFLQPLPLERFWLWMLLPLVYVIALVYKSLKLPSLEKLGRETLMLGSQMLALMVLAALGLWLLTEML